MNANSKFAALVIVVVVGLLMVLNILSGTGQVQVARETTQKTAPKIARKANVQGDAPSGVPGSETGTAGANLATDTEADVWRAFMVKKGDEDRTGFIDASGRVRVEATLPSEGVDAQLFDDIVAVFQLEGSYYLTKTGKTVARGEVWLEDFQVDCESEGFIRFMPQNTQLTGLLDKNGEVAIAAKYGQLSRVSNGLVVALRGAQRECVGSKDDPHCGWRGGQTVLLDTRGKVLVEDFRKLPDAANLDFNSLRVTSQPLDDPTRESFRGVDGRYYSFVDFRKDIHAWLNSGVLVGHGLEALRSVLFDRLHVEDIYGKDAVISRNDLTAADEKLWWSVLAEAARSKEIRFISDADPLIQYDEANTAFLPRQYYDNCGRLRQGHSPILEVVLDMPTRLLTQAAQDRVSYRWRVSFLKSDAGYRIVRLNQTMWASW